MLKDDIQKLCEEGKSVDEIIDFALQNYKSIITSEDIASIIELGKEFDEDVDESTNKVLVFDIETAPIISYTWGVWEQNIVGIVRDWYILCFAYKWLGEKKIHVLSLPDYETYKKDRHDDKDLVNDLWSLFNDADALIAHNGDNFDIKKANARFAFHKLSPPSPYKQIDTLKIAKKHFKFDSNSLDKLGRYLGIGRKTKHEGFGLWEGCMDGDKNAWKRMVKYNRQDVNLLEEVYLELRPWASTQYNFGMLSKSLACSHCGSNNLQSRGTARNKTTVYRRIHCTDCGGWSRTANNTRDDKPLVSL